MNETKSILASKTIWGLILATVFLALRVFKVPLTDDQHADIAALIENLGTIAGILFAGYGRVTATAKIGSAAEVTTPPAAPLLFLVGALVIVAGCADRNATQIYAQAMATSTMMHEAAHTYHVTAVAANVPKDKRYQVEQDMNLVLQPSEAVVDQLKQDSTDYQAAIAGNNDKAAAAANDRAKLANDALNALATRLNKIAAQQAPKAPATTRPAG